MDEGILIENETKSKIQKPRKYKVLLLNDNYTTMEFVVEVIMSVFGKSFNEASKIMMDVHKKGKGIVGIYTYDIAVTKVKEVENLARKSNFPLKAKVEEDL
jgi:ATP-dependent Clp protease adaptor protein ClpS